MGGEKYDMSPHPPKRADHSDFGRLLRCVQPRKRMPVVKYGFVAAKDSLPPAKPIETLYILLACVRRVRICLRYTFAYMTSSQEGCRPLRELSSCARGCASATSIFPTGRGKSIVHLPVNSRQAWHEPSDCIVQKQHLTVGHDAAFVCSSFFLSPAPYAADGR